MSKELTASAVVRSLVAVLETRYGSNINYSITEPSKGSKNFEIFVADKQQK